jgi:hypothetical protein
MVVGFAGNIDAGFGVVAQMAHAVAASVPAGWLINEPSRFLLTWADRAAYAWAHSIPASEKERGCALLAIVAPKPPQGSPSWPTVGWILEAPAFEPEPIPRGTARSIRSGAYVPEYAAELEKLGAEFLKLSMFEIQAFQEIGGALAPITSALSNVIEAHEAHQSSPNRLLGQMGSDRVGYERDGSDQ